MFNKVLCPICVDDHFRIVLDSETLSKKILKCEYCDLCIQPALGSVGQGSDSLTAFYSRDRYNQHQKQADRPTALQRYNHDYYVANQRFKQLKYALPHPIDDENNIRRSWVDMGCSNGAFISYARSKGYLVTGLELDKDCTLELSKLLLFKCTTPRDYFAGPHVDHTRCILSMFDVLEHLLDPVGFLLEYAAQFGTVVIEVPDHAKVTDFENWKHYRPDEHLTYWTHKSFERLLYGPRKLGEKLKIVHCNYPIEDK